MVMRHYYKLVLLLASAVALLLCVSLSTAQAYDNQPGGGQSSAAPAPPATQPTGGTPTGGSSGSTSTGSAGTCGLYGGPSGMGMVCAGTSGGSTIQQVLAGQPVPGCWDADPFASNGGYGALTDQQITDDGLTPSPDFNFYLERCLTGLDPTTFAVAPGGIKISQQVVYRLKSAPACSSPPPATQLGLCVMTLTLPQHNFVADRASNIPYPTAVPSPLPMRVNEQITFTSEGDTVIGPINPGLGVQLRARMLSFTVFPLGADGVALPCGAVQLPDGHAAYQCKYTYQQSSARQPNAVYRVRVQARWVVEFQDGGGWQALGAPFDMYSDNSYPVSEIQTVVVPGG